MEAGFSHPYTYYNKEFSRVRSNGMGVGRVSKNLGDAMASLVMATWLIRRITSSSTCCQMWSF